MATPGTSGTLHQVTVHMRQQGQQVLNVWDFYLNTNVDDLEVRLLRALLECYLTVLLPGSGSLLTVERVTGHQTGPDVGPMYEISPEVADVLVGASAGDTLPTHDSVSIGIHSTRAGKHGRGRKQIPGIPEVATTGSTINTAHAYWGVLLAFATCVASKFIHATELDAPNTISVGVLARSLKPLDANGKRKEPWAVSQFAHATRLTVKPQVGTTNSRKVGRGS